MSSDPVQSVIRKQLRPAVSLLLLLTLLCGILYPLAITGIAQVIFPVQANGNLIEHDGRVTGSVLIGQPFSSPGYFWGRPSATSGVPDNASLSSGSNLGPTNPALPRAVRARVEALHEADPSNTHPIPVDLVTSSGSGLDPDISVAAAYYQVSRIARERDMTEQEVRWLVDLHTEQPQFGFLGEARVNILSLNLALDDLGAGRISAPPVSEIPPPQPDADATFLGMKVLDWLQLILIGVILALLIVPIGRWMARVYTGERTFLTPLIGPLERGFYRISGVHPDEEMDWKAFAIAMLVFNMLGILAVWTLQLIQQMLPLNPLGIGPVPLDLSLNTAVSFATNTNWQAYAGETTLSYLTQMIGLTVQNFVSAATGMAILIALIYGLSRKSTDRLGNFWVLLVRGVIILLPISCILALLLVSQGAVQSLGGPVTVMLLDPVTESGGDLITTQALPLGPAASQVAIKVLGTNGGGFFNTNSAHPFENPTPFSNFVEVLALLLIPVCLCFTFGKLVGSARKGIALLIAMTIIFIPLLGLATWSELGGNPAFNPLGINQVPGQLQPGGNMEGKELRFGVPASALFSIATTATSCGAVNSMHDSFMPLGGFAQLLMMQCGEVVYGGVGSGLYGMLVFAIIAMFIAGLMVGRTPEYLGKKIEPYEMQLATIIILIPIFLILIGASIAVLTDPGKTAVLNPGPHGFSEILYAFTSAGQNNGSAFAGLSANNLFYNLGLALVMLVARYGVAVLTLALAGSLAMKKIVPASEGTLHDHRLLFIIWLVFVIVIIGALSFLPALALGPIVEYLIQSVRRGVNTLTDHGDSRHPAITEPALYKRAIIDSVLKLDPRNMVHNIVMFVVEIGAALTTLFWLQALTGQGSEAAGFIGAISIWLWFTVIFANFAEALAEGRGKAQAESLRKMRQDTDAKKLVPAYSIRKGVSPSPSDYTLISSQALRKSDLFTVMAGDIIPADGEVVEGVASVNESAITGESAPVIRESGGDRSAVTGGTVVLSDWLIVRASANPGEGFLDHMISLVEGAKRQRTPNEIALNILLIGLTAIFIVVCATLWAFSSYSVAVEGAGETISVTVLIALLVCLAPTTIGGLLSAIGIAGMDRLIQRNVITTSGRAIEAAGDVDVLLLDKTGTITLGNRQAVELIPVDGTDIADLAETAQLASLADETPEGRSIVVLVKERYGLRGRTVGASATGPEMEFIPFSSQTRMSGVNIGTTRIRKGAADVVFSDIRSGGNQVSDELTAQVNAIAGSGGTPLVVTKDGKAFGVVHLKDVVKGGIKERFTQLRRMGIKTVMITGDNRLTAATIAAEAGVDDFLAEATPESKLRMIRDYQAGGRMVAMTGDGTNDAPALAQADVAVAMNTGTQPAREAANMIDLDSNPTKLIEIVEIGKQLLMTRGSLTTFSIANDLAKYFAIIPAAFISTYPALAALNILGLRYAILSAVIFNALIIVFLIPLALHGVKYRPMTAEEALRNNIIIYGVGGIIAPFIGIKAIDLILTFIGG